MIISLLSILINLIVAQCGGSGVIGWSVGGQYNSLVQIDDEMTILASVTPTCQTYGQIRLTTPEGATYGPIQWHQAGTTYGTTAGYTVNVRDLNSLLMFELGVHLQTLPGVYGSFGNVYEIPARNGGDVNFDGVVDALDLLSVIEHWGETGPRWQDVDGNNVVDVDDLLVVIGAWT